MSLSPEQIKQIANLARLELAPEQVDTYARQLSNIFDMVSQLSQADTSQVSVMAHPLEMVQRLRPDTISAPVGEQGRTQFQAIAPAVENGLYCVPKVIE
jgi:aspartyl-tRNA(Asn)/glutamyl-tRNA(Gln) amidotransferase subunit C